MSLLRGKQPQITKISPHNANKKYILPRRSKRKALCTNFTDLTDVGNQYFTYPRVTITDDFKVEAYFWQRPGFGGLSGQPIVGEMTSYAYYIVINTNGTVSCRASNILTSSSLVNDNQEHYVVFERVGTVITLKLDGVLESSQDPGSKSSVAWNAIAAKRDLGAHLDGYVREHKVFDAGVLKRHFKVNESWSGASTELIDYSGLNKHGISYNITDADVEKRCLNYETVPDQWENVDKSLIIPVAY